MNNEKIIEVLEDLKNYVNENWDEEYREDIDNANVAINMVVKMIRKNEIVGRLVLEGEEYLISKVHVD